MSDRFSGRGWGLVMVVSATACWSTSGMFINLLVISTGVTPAVLAFWRDLAVGLGLFAVLAVTRRSALRVARADLPWLAVMGMFGVGLFHFCWNTSVLANGAALSTIIQSNGPILVALAAWLLYREPLTWRKGAAVLLTIAGTVLIARNSGPARLDLTWPGLLVTAGVPVLYATYSVTGKRVAGSYSPWTILAYVFTFGALALLPMQWGSTIPWPLPPIAVIGFAGQTLLTTICGYGLFTAGLRRLQASVASIVATTEVLFASIFAYFFLGERLAPSQLVGAVLIVSGVVLLSYRRNVPATWQQSADEAPNKKS